jgi:hypothetical protein
MQPAYSIMMMAADPVEGKMQEDEAPNDPAPIPVAAWPSLNCLDTGIHHHVQDGAAEIVRTNRSNDFTGMRRKHV